MPYFIRTNKDNAEEVSWASSASDTHVIVVPASKFPLPAWKVANLLNDAYLEGKKAAALEIKEKLDSYL